VKSTDDSPTGFFSCLRRDLRNQRRFLLWALAWAFTFVAVALEIKRKWLPFGVTLAGVTLDALLGAATVLAYYRYLRDTDELRRKIEVEALAVAFGIGVFGGLTYWLLTVSGAVPALGFAYVFSGMVITYSVGVLIGRRRYS
jgi:ABC-type Co2+ transport system permease subunit